MAKPDVEFTCSGCRFLKELHCTKNELGVPSLRSDPACRDFVNRKK